MHITAPDSESPKFVGTSIGKTQVLGDILSVHLGVRQSEGPGNSGAVAVSVIILVHVAKIVISRLW